MASVTVDPTVPQNIENESLGASRIRNLAGWVNALFSQSTSAPYTYVQAPFSIDATNLPTVVSNAVSPLGIVALQQLNSAVAASGVITNGGSGSAFAGSVIPSITSYLKFAVYLLQWTQASQGNDTVNLNAIGPVTVKKLAGGTLVNLTPGDIPAGAVIPVVFDGTYLEIIGSTTPVNALFQTRAYKLIDQSVTSSVALVNDANLVFAIAASEIWQFELDLYSTFDSVSASGLKAAFTVPAGATLQWGANNQAPVLVSGTAMQLVAGGGAGAGTNIQKVIGQVINGSTAGTVQLQWAQNTSNATATELKAGSSLLATRMSP